jgi:hypothetical protein
VPCIRALAVRIMACEGTQAVCTSRLSHTHLRIWQAEDPSFDEESTFLDTVQVIEL